MDVDCPICGSIFPSCRIEQHAEQCIEAKFGCDSDGKGKSSKQSKRKSFEVLDDANQGNGEGPSNTPPRTPPSSKKTRKDQVEAWSFLGKSAKTPHKGKTIQHNTNANVESSSHTGISNCSKSKDGSNTVPLAERMRPLSLENYIGQESILSSHSFLRTLLQNNNFTNMILWGPPGCGKTSLANIIRERCRRSEGWKFTSLSACTSGVADVKNVVTEARSVQQLRGKRTLLFMDEVHRFNKAQQDIFLPHVESGLLTLVGATTENPSFTLNSALLSRCRVITLDGLTPAHIRKILRRTLRQLKVAVDKSKHQKDSEERQTETEKNGHDLNEDSNSSDDQKEASDRDNDKNPYIGTKISDGAVRWVSEMSGGDARCALNTLQILLDSNAGFFINIQQAKEALQRSHVLYDRKGDEHYNFASALQKSIRGGDDNAALYWTMRMVRGGEDPRFIARRLLRTAAEDIGLGTPEALTMATSTMQAVQMLGMPESDVILAQCAVYLARAHHNPEVYLAMRKVNQHIDTHVGPLPSVPLHLRNPTTKLMKNLGYGRGYSNAPEDVGNITYMPDALKGVDFFKH